MSDLATQLHDITAHIPAAIGGRIDAGVGEVTASGVAPGLAVGDTAPDFTLGDALGQRLQDGAQPVMAGAQALQGVLGRRHFHHSGFP